MAAICYWHKASNVTTTAGEKGTWEGWVGGFYGASSYLPLIRAQSHGYTNGKEPGNNGAQWCAGKKRIWGDKLVDCESEPKLLTFSLKALCLLASDYLTALIFLHSLIPSSSFVEVPLDYLSHQQPPVFPQLHPILWSITSDSQHGRLFACPTPSVLRNESGPAGQWG